MAMKIYALTSLGKRLARSTQNPDTPGWKIVHYLDSTGIATSDQIIDSTGLSEEDTGSNLGNLKRKGVVREVTKQGGY